MKRSKSCQSCTVSSVCFFWKLQQYVVIVLLKSAPRYVNATRPGRIIIISFSFRIEIIFCGDQYYTTNAAGFHLYCTRTIKFKQLNFALNFPASFSGSWMPTFLSFPRAAKHVCRSEVGLSREKELNWHNSCALCCSVAHKYRDLWTCTVFPWQTSQATTHWEREVDRNKLLICVISLLCPSLNITTCSSC